MQLRPRNRVGTIATIGEPAIPALELCNYLPPVHRSRPRRAKFTKGNSQAKAIERIALQYG
ncbi:MAG: hypothetical protein ABSE63_10045 [Thermoguttaceae bacterium]